MGSSYERCYFSILFYVGILKYRLLNVLVGGALIVNYFVSMLQTNASVRLILVCNTVKTDLSIVALQLCYDLFLIYILVQRDV